MKERTDMELANWLELNAYDYYVKQKNNAQHYLPMGNMVDLIFNGEINENNEKTKSSKKTLLLS